MFERFHLEWLFNLLHAHLFKLQLTLFFVWFAFTRAPARIIKIRKLLLECLVGFLIIHNVLSPFYSIAWSYVSTATGSINSDAIGRTYQAIARVWLAISGGGMFVIFSGYFCSKLLPWNMVENRSTKKSGTGTEEQQKGEKLEDQKLDKAEPRINTNITVATMTDQKIEEIIYNVLNKVGLTSKLDPGDFIPETPLRKDESDPRIEGEGLVPSLENENQKDLPHWTPLENRIEEMHKERQIEVGLFSNYLEAVIDRLDDLYYGTDKREIKVDELDLCSRKGGESKTKKRVQIMEDGRDGEASDEEGAEDLLRDDISNALPVTKEPPVLPTVRANPMLLTDKEGRKRQRSRVGALSNSDDVEMTIDQQESIQHVRTLNELKETIRNIQQQMKDQKEQLQRLTEEEKRMNRAELEKKWHEERFIKRFGPREPTPLTEEEKEMNRTQLYKKLMQDRRDRWAQIQREKGMEVYQCESCGRYERTGSEHICFRIPLKGPLRRKTGVPLHDQLVLEGTKGGLNIKQHPIIDIELLKKEHAAMTKTLEGLGGNHLATQKGEMNTDSLRDIENQEEEAESSAKKVMNITKDNRNF